MSEFPKELPHGLSQHALLYRWSGTVSKKDDVQCMYMTCFENNVRIIGAS